MKSAQLLKIVFYLSSFLLFSCQEEISPTDTKIEEYKRFHVASISPDSSNTDKTIVITGENFLKDSMSVWFTPLIPARVDSIKPSQIYVTVPSRAQSGPIIISDGKNSDTMNIIFKVLRETWGWGDLSISDFIPKSGFSGTLVQIQGFGFGTQKENVRAFFGAIEAEVVGVENTLITIRVPLGSGKSLIALNINGVTAATKEVFQNNLRYIQLESFSPIEGHVGTEVVLKLNNLKNDTNGIVIKFGDVRAEVRYQYHPTSPIITAIVPEGAYTAPISVSFHGEKSQSKNNFTVLDDEIPIITSIEPTSGIAGITTVTVRGENFTHTNSNLSVQIGNAEVVISAGPFTKELKFLLPDNATTSKICVKNIEGEQGCSEKEFLVHQIYKNANLSFGGLKVLRQTSYEDMSYDTIKTNKTTDTIILKDNYNIARCKVPNHDLFYSVGYCFGYPEYLPYADSILQCFEFRSNYPTYDYVYQIADISVDSIAKIIKFIKITKYQYKRHDEDYTGYRHKIIHCNHETFILKDIPYQLVSGKIHIQLNSSDVGKYLTQYNSEFSYLDNKEVGRWAYSKRESVVNKIYQILPDAFFELTLE